MDVTLERILSLLPHTEDGKIRHGAKAELARGLGFDSGDVVSMWIKGTSKSYQNYLYEIAVKYGVSVAWLRGDTDDPAPHPEGELPEVTMIARAGRKMSPERRQDMIKLLKLVFPEEFSDD